MYYQYWRCSLSTFNEERGLNGLSFPALRLEHLISPAVVVCLLGEKSCVLSGSLKLYIYFWQCGLFCKIMHLWCFGKVNVKKLIWVTVILLPFLITEQSGVCKSNCYVEVFKKINRSFVIIFWYAYTVWSPYCQNNIWAEFIHLQELSVFHKCVATFSSLKNMYNCHRNNQCSGPNVWPT